MCPAFRAQLLVDPDVSRCMLSCWQGSLLPLAPMLLPVLARSASTSARACNRVMQVGRLVASSLHLVTLSTRFSLSPRLLVMGRAIFSASPWVSPSPLLCVSVIARVIVPACRAKQGTDTFAFRNFTHAHLRQDSDACIHPSIHPSIHPYIYL